MQKVLEKHLSNEMHDLTVRFYHRQRQIVVKPEWCDLAQRAAFECLKETGMFQLADMHAYQRAEIHVFQRIEMHVTWAGPRVIRQMNRVHRQIDRVTDVLSFPGITWQEGTPLLEPGDIDPETGTLFLGDLVICLQRMLEQAEEYGHSVERELAFLVAHGTLHLLGWDHQEEEESIRMFTFQETILTRMGLKREESV